MEMSIAIVCTSLVGLVAWTQWLREQALLAKENEELEQQLLELGDVEGQEIPTQEPQGEPEVAEKGPEELERGESQSWY